MPRIVTIQFTTAGKLYDFNAGELEVAPNDEVIVETERGIAVAEVVSAPTERSQEEVPANLLMIKRVATPEDKVIIEKNRSKEKEAYEFCNRRIIERNMQMKLVRVEYLFDGSKAIFYFTADGRVDFRDLVKDLAHTFHTRIEMRQIGVRDESKMVGGIGICGRELCCCSWLRDFQPVSVKMAKEQNLALNPNKISGQCGRLLCCLDYEYETYCCLRKSLPKCGKRIQAGAVSGVVDKMNILTGSITLKLDDGKLLTVKKEEMSGEAAPAETPAQQPDPQKNRERKERGGSAPSPRNEPKNVAASDAPPRGATPQQEGQAKGPRKKRSRRHGNRKPGGGAPPDSTPSSGN